MPITDHRASDVTAIVELPGASSHGRTTLANLIIYNEHLPSQLERLPFILRTS